VQKDKCRLWAGGGINGQVVSSAITCLNEFGTPDRGVNTYKTADFRIAVFGQGNIASHTISSDSKYSQVAARLIRGPVRKPYATAVGIDQIGMTLADCKTAYSELLTHHQPDVVIVAITPQSSDALGRVSWANDLAAQGIFALCVVERSDFEVALPAVLVENAKVPIIDPATEFNAYTGSGLLIWADVSGIWAPQAHAILGKLISQELIKQFKPVS
jgi:hypothetical protein